VIGHLGNTLAALDLVRAAGAEGVEIDVRRTSDGALVLHHDAVIEGLGPITRLSSDQVPDILPRLDVVLDACNGLVVNIEVKNLRTDPDRDPAEHLATEVAQLLNGRSLQENVIVSSFSLQTLDAVRATDPAIPTGFLTLSAWDQPAALRMAAQAGHRALHPQQAGVTSSLIELVHSKQMWIIPWAVDRAGDIMMAASEGVDAFITDAPDLALATLGGHSGSARPNPPGFPRPIEQHPRGTHS
jgi:glycerophosphoryl diester phosphodiesterase